MTGPHRWVLAGTRGTGGNGPNGSETRRGRAQ